MHACMQAIYSYIDIWWEVRSKIRLKFAVQDRGESSSGSCEGNTRIIHEIRRLLLQGDLYDLQTAVAVSYVVLFRFKSVLLTDAMCYAI